MRIGLLTGGGDVPGLNPCIRAVVLAADEAGHEVLGFRRGWRGVVDAALSDDPMRLGHVRPLRVADVRGIDRQGGTILHTARFDPTRDAGDHTQAILRLIERLGLGALVVLGGDGTLRSAVHFHRLGVPVVAVPKTMDNDVHGTDYAIGFATAVSRSVAAINALRTTVASHERLGVVELFGRRSGETALLSGFLAQADRTAIAEVPVDPARLFPLLAEDRRANPEGYALLVVSEGATLSGETPADLDLSGSARVGEGVGRRLARAFEAATGIGTIVQELAYLMRAGEPDALDRMVGFAFGALAVELVNQRRFGRLVALLDGNYATSGLEIIMEGARRVDVARRYDVERFRPRLAGIEGLPMFVY
ncbi:MAG: 6-phosphofructokinase [Sphingomonadaceae bacterium]|uniref:6-phosphofructokinase n=1 Tax=Thermaurantiacus sp. TaxID=2820283 RepID=UPI00298F3E12|nr:6-phosphofructokinase [Thermaurantiacus sp.]MCS6986798.1 6-phosphofructokinase [Sphingomonadaceae bacterium]MDW8413939.1 6-phosphofructokinase [Thermaurantiacus sp.]